MPPVEPVADEIVDATLPYLPPVVADLVRFQRLVGCRPTEACIVRPCDVDRSDEVWCYTPSSHKTEHHNRRRTVFIGPRAQDVLRPYLLRDATSYCFCPADSEKKRLAALHEQRKTPLSCGNRPGRNRKRKPKKQPGELYTNDTYNRAVRRAVDAANKARAENKLPPLPYWSPNRLRHAARTEIRKQFGLEAAQVVLGHSKAQITEVYAERDQGLALRVVGQIG